MLLYCLELEMIPYYHSHFLLLSYFVDNHISLQVFCKKNKGKIHLIDLRFGLVTVRFKIFQNWSTWSPITVRDSGGATHKGGGAKAPPKFKKINL